MVREKVTLVILVTKQISVGSLKKIRALRLALSPLRVPQGLVRHILSRSLGKLLKNFHYVIPYNLVSIHCVIKSCGIIQTGRNMVSVFKEFVS